VVSGGWGIGGSKKGVNTSLTLSKSLLGIQTPITY
jgi:hypothetical protein